MNINYNLKDKQKNETLILAILRAHGKKAVLSTSIKIKPARWDFKKQRAKSVQGFKSQALHINNKLSIFTDKINSITQKIEEVQKALPANVKEQYLKSTTTSTPSIPKGLTFLEFAKDLINHRATSPSFTPGTIKNYRKLYNHLTNYHSLKPFDFQDMDFQFIENLTNYFYSLGHSTNYVRALLKDTKVFLNAASDYGIKTNKAYTNKRLNIKEEATYNIFISSAELKQLQNLDLKDRPKLERVRDRFLIGAYTGLRYSDYSLLVKQNFSNINGKTFIIDETRKTGEPVLIPAHPTVITILEKYNYQLPKPISRQKFNDYLKELFLLAEFTQDVIIYKSKAGRRIKTIKQKYQLITSHTARRSFITNALIAGISETVIMKLTGIKKRDTLQKYIKLTPLDTAALAANNPFFKE